jgi:adenylate cyclase class IV
VEHQLDTYFRVPSGRLKLREIDGQPPVLIWYERPDQTGARTLAPHPAPPAPHPAPLAVQTGARTSLYYLVPVTEPALLKSVLTAALGSRGVIEKRREIFLWHNVRIHLDEVAGLGSFVEFEAVITSKEEEAKAPGQLQFLCVEFGIAPADHLASSYADLVGF